MGAPGNPLGHLDDPHPLDGRVRGEMLSTTLGAFKANGMSVGMDDVRHALSRRPDKVLDAIRKICETQETLIADFIFSPLETEQDVRVAKGKQGRILGLQDVLQTFIQEVFEEEEPGDQQEGQ